MRTTKRIAKKQAAQMVARCFSLPMALTLAKPSFFEQPPGKQRDLLRWAMVHRCDVSPRLAAYAVRGWTFTPAPQSAVQESSTPVDGGAHG